MHGHVGIKLFDLSSFLLASALGLPGGFLLVRDPLLENLLWSPDLILVLPSNLHRQLGLLHGGVAGGQRSARPLSLSTPILKNILC